MNLKKFVFSTLHPSWAGAAAIIAIRIGVGLLMLSSHGWGKYMHFNTLSLAFPDPLGIGSMLSLMLTIFAELFCSILLILGLFTRLALIPLIITMAVAIGIIHAGDAFQQKELALVYLIIYIMLMITGPGKFSLDAYFSRKFTNYKNSENPNDGLWK